jgi:hypothetical protein
MLPSNRQKGAPRSHHTVIGAIQYVDAGAQLLERGPESERMKASEILRSLVSAIVLTPADEGFRLMCRVIWPVFCRLRRTQKNPAVLRAGCLQVSLVAGTGFEPVTFRL